MQLAAVIKARALALIDIDELNLQGKVRLADGVPLLAKQFSFLKFPSEVEDFDLEKGIEFTSGRSGDRVIDCLKIYSGLIYVETLSSTSDSRHVLEEILLWGKEELGLTYTEGMIRHWAYISQVTFFTNFPLLLAISSPLEKLAKKTTDVVDGFFEEGLKFEPAVIVIGHDPLRRKNGIAGLRIEHRANVRFEENKYYSEAPLPTDLHLRFLEEFEADILESRTSGR